MDSVQGLEGIQDSISNTQEKTVHFTCSKESVNFEKMGMQFNLTSGNETKIVTYILTDSVSWFNCMTEVQSIGLGLKTTNGREAVRSFTLQRRVGEKKNPSLVYRILCILVVMQSANKECNCFQTKTLKKLLFISD